MEVEGRVAITRIQEELEQYRRLMEVPPPEEFEEGFSIRTILGALFVAFVMLPGAAYLGLVAGISGQLSSAAQWVTVILFVEVARRSFIVLKRQEIYLLVILATAILGTNPYTGYIWNVFMRTSQVTQGLGVADKIPTWVVPPADSPAILHRTFFHPDWLIPIAVSLALLVLGRTVEFTAGYILFRITSDYERLPFPMAPVGAQAATVLAEISRKEETWRWRYFSTGAMIGLAFGFFYAGIPTITGAVMTRPLQLIPIPFIDLTLNTESVLPATPVAIFTDLGGFLWGFVVPFWVAIGGFIGSLLTTVLNPLLYRRGILRNWKPGYDAIKVEMVNTYDFWLSAGIGRGLGLAAVSLASVLATTWRESQRRRELLRQGLGQPTERIPLTAVLTHRGDLRPLLPLSASVAHHLPHLLRAHLHTHHLVCGRPNAWLDRAVVWYPLRPRRLYHPLQQVDGLSWIGHLVRPYPHCRLRLGRPAFSGSGVDGNEVHWRAENRDRYRRHRLAGKLSRVAILVAPCSHPFLCLPLRSADVAFASLHNCFVVDNHFREARVTSVAPASHRRFLRRCCGGLPPLLPLALQSAHVAVLRVGARSRWMASRRIADFSRGIGLAVLL